jgi:hypothetical protein
LRNGTLFRWNATVPAGQGSSSALVHLHPSLRVELGWGSGALPAPSAVNYTAAAKATAVPTATDGDWVLSSGATVTSSRNLTLSPYDLRSGGPGQDGLALVSHPLNSKGHLLSRVDFAFRYAAGYTPPAGKHTDAATLSLALVDALNGSTVSTLYTSPSLGNYSFDAFNGYSPPVVANCTGLAVSWPRSLRVALLFHNHERNLQIPVASIELSITWSAARQREPFTPTDLSTPPTNAAAVRRGPLLFALPLEQQASTLRMPAHGGECEKPKAAGCRSTDEAFARGDGVEWNYALLLNEDDPAAALTLHRTADRASHVPFDPSKPPLSISVSARRVMAWQAKPGGMVAEAPPPSPVSCSGNSTSATSQCSAVATLRLVPFGATSIRIGAFPWVQVPV